jgi:7-cyano-7-deazaguanine synthase
MPRPAVVLLSGGLDSATTLAIARREGYECHALSFDYGQRHRFELEAARRIAVASNLKRHIIMTIDLRAFGGSALTANIDVPKDRIGSASPGTVGAATVRERAGAGSGEIPITYVPARNTIFLSFALGFAEVLETTDIFIGVNAIDYSGYPDCRPAFIEQFERLANLATRIGVEHAARGETALRIHAPLIDLTKAQIIRRGIELGVDYALTFSCYDPLSDGTPCGHCDACLLRAAGFREAGVPDPAPMP